MAVKIVTDSTSYIPKSLLAERNIPIVSLNIIFGDEIIREADFKENEFLEKMDEFIGHPKSSQPTVAEFVDTFEKILKNEDDIVGIFISSKLSGTYATANIAKDIVLEAYPHRTIELVDSTTVAMELGFSVLEAIRLADKGLSPSEIVFEVEKFKSRTNLIFSPKTLEALQKGGRIGKAQSLVAQAIQIKPILSLSNGEIVVAKKVRTQKKAIEEMIDIMLIDFAKFGVGEVVIQHIDALEHAQELVRDIRKKTGTLLENEVILIEPLGAVISAHVGKGTIGFAYYTMNPIKHTGDELNE